MGYKTGRIAYKERSKGQGRSDNWEKAKKKIAEGELKLAKDAAEIAAVGDCELQASLARLSATCANDACSLLESRSIMNINCHQGTWTKLRSSFSITATPSSLMYRRPECNIMKAWDDNWRIKAA